jgi:hypothetical protein
VATKSSQTEPEKAEVIEELLDTLDTTLDRLKVLYEQYFLGIQKQPPTQLHIDVERKLRDLAQMQIRNTGLRYRFATLQQKFGSYNSYWRRTLKQIENGTYARNLLKIGRQAVQTGQEIPEEILAAMPKRMRDQVKRDRDAALAIAKRRAQPEADVEATAAVVITEATGTRRNVLSVGGAHLLSDDDGELDMDALFKEFEGEPEPAPPPQPANVRAAAVGAGRRSSPSIPMPSAARPPGPAPRAPADTMPKAPGAPSTGVPPSQQTRPTPIAAPSQVTRPNPIRPGSSTVQPPIAVESMSGPFPRAPTPDPSGPAAPPRPAPRPAAPPVGAARPASPPSPKPPAEAPMRPPPGMSDADVNALYAKYVKAKEAIGDNAGPGAYGKLLKTINAQAPKIMEQYKAKGVEFSIVVKDNQVIIKAKPKT